MPKLSREKRMGLRTWIEIDTKKAERNFKNLKRLLNKDTKFGAVTKSNAYGHGLIGYSKLMEKVGADWLCVDSIMEARALRREGIKKPLLVLGHTLPENFKLAKSLKISLTISTFGGLRKIKTYGTKIHLKFDTGMGRQGFLEKDLPKILRLIVKNKIIVEGVYTHFAKAKVPKKRTETDKQIEIFKRIVNQFKKEGYKPITHAAATSGTIVYPEAHLDMVRVGIGIYGLWPEEAVRRQFSKKIKLEPVLSWKTVVSEVKELPKGHGIGYDLTHKLKRKSKIVVCPIGYWHGYLRAFSNKASILIRGRRAKLLGRVSMGMIVVDVTDVKGVKVGDVVTLIGKDKKEEVTADELAKLAGTINYEIVTRTNPLIKKFYL